MYYFLVFVQFKRVEFSVIELANRFVAWIETLFFNTLFSMIFSVLSDLFNDFCKIVPNKAIRTIYENTHENMW